MTIDTTPKRYLFTLHLWQEPLDADQVEWRGRIKHVRSGEIRYFRDSESLYEALMSTLVDIDAGLLSD